MKVNAVNYTGGRVQSGALGQMSKTKKLAPIGYENHIKMVDVIPISSLIGASLMSVYFIKKGNLDIAMRAVHI